MSQLAVLVVVFGVVLIGYPRLVDMAEAQQESADGDAGSEDSRRSNGFLQPYQLQQQGLLRPYQLQQGQRPLTPTLHPLVTPGIVTLSPLSFVECYVCTNCPNVLKNTTSKLCPMTQDNSKKSCVTYSEKYRHMNKPFYIRGCASERGNCADIKQAHIPYESTVQLQSCNECEGNKCNTSDAPRTVLDYTMALLALIIVPIASKITIS